MQDNPHSRMTHELGIKHKEAVARSEWRVSFTCFWLLSLAL